MRDRPGHDSSTDGPADLRLIRVEEADGHTWGFIVVRGIVVRAPSAQFRGATLTAMLEWALYGGHRLIGLGTDWLAQANGEAGSPDCIA